MSSKILVFTNKQYRRKTNDHAGNYEQNETANKQKIIKA